MLRHLFWFTRQSRRISWTCGIGNKQCKFRQKIKWIGLENCSIRKMRLKRRLRSTYSCIYLYIKWGSTICLSDIHWPYLCFKDKKKQLKMDIFPNIVVFFIINHCSTADLSHRKTKLTVNIKKDRRRSCQNLHSVKM